MVSGGWLLKTVKTMVNAGSRLCAFVGWVEFASPFLLVFIFCHLQFWDEGTKTMVGLILVSVSFLCFFSPSRSLCSFFFCVIGPLFSPVPPVLPSCSRFSPRFFPPFKVSCTARSSVFSVFFLLFSCLFLSVQPWLCLFLPPFRPPSFSFFLCSLLLLIKPENGLSSRVRASRSWGTNASVS